MGDMGHFCDTIASPVLTLEDVGPGFEGQGGSLTFMLHHLQDPKTPLWGDLLFQALVGLEQCVAQCVTV